VAQTQDAPPGKALVTPLCQQVIGVLFNHNDFVTIR